MLDKAKVKEIPMLFTDEMANACRTGIKTETRRLRGLEEVNQSPENWEYKYPEKDRLVFLNKEDGQLYYMKNHYGLEGDVIWVREAWKGTLIPDNYQKPMRCIQYRSDLSIKMIDDSEFEWFDNRFKDGKFKWEPNMFLRRVFARTFLSRTFIRCERLQDITPESAVAEGIYIEKLSDGINLTCPARWRYSSEGMDIVFPRPEQAYKALWELINGPESWETNPWVIVVGFQKVDNYEQ